MDLRIRELLKILIEHSCSIKRGENVLIDYEKDGIFQVPELNALNPEIILNNQKVYFKGKI